MNATEKLIRIYSESADPRLYPIIEEMTRSDEHSMRSYMERLALHICKWSIQSERRSRSWAGSILDSQHQLETWFEDSPSLKSKVDQNWARALAHARRMAAVETGIDPGEWTMDFPAAMAYEPTFEDEA